MAGFRAMLVEALRDRAAPAVFAPGEVLTGRELLARAGGLAEWLSALDMPRGQPVPALLDADADALALVVAGALAGRPIAPLNARAPEAELATTMQSLASGLLLAQLATEELARRTAEPRSGLRVVVPPYGTQRRALPPLTDSPAVGLVLHTSGTTGAPRAVQMSDEALAARARAYADAVELRAADRHATVATFHHIAGVGTHLVAIATGAAAVVVPRFDLAAWRRTREFEPTHVVLVPTMIEMLLEAGELAAGQRVLVYGAAPIDPATLGRLARTLNGTQLVQLFGLTEGSPITRLAHEDHVAALAGQPELLHSIGRPLPGVELRIEQPDADGVGEIAARAAHLAHVERDGWLRTGDLGELRDGYVYLRGRRGDKIIRGGENIYPLAVERVLASHPRVAEAAVIGRPDRRLGEVPWGCVVADGAQPSVEELEDFLRARLSAFNVPVGWTFLEALPRNASGKVLRREIKIEE
jgi:acyl-CoA synthetase (AMP-forming)/AMP-acid ligase II